MGTESIEASFLSIFALISFFIFLLVSKYSHKIRGGALLDGDFSKPQAFHDLVFQTQVAYLIPIFGILFGYFLMDEIITWRVLVSLVIILTGIYIFKKNNKG